ncbi:MAG: Crp/Fnr family transcriptional regulator [Pyrinomonadaceae bacterium]|nr:Crp/Fnr family transcriptional regulator [Pyrinomonadaceae bacterium]MDQ3134402.1 Crp/Fnr family transcriptional regulator [Acidobacteriota bacterium]
MAHRRACDLNAPDRANLLRHTELSAALSDSLIREFASVSFAVDVRRRRFIYRAGDTPDALYLIARGRIKLCCLEPGTGREAVIDILPTGSLFGEFALYASGARQMSAVAYENARLLRIPVEKFRQLMAESSELYDYTFRLLGQRLSRAERRLADFALDAIPARLEKLLAELSERYGRCADDGVLIDLALPHREIASIVGSTRESITVRLNDMRRAGMIDFVDRKILIKHPPHAAAAVVVAGA